MLGVAKKSLYGSRSLIFSSVMCVAQFQFFQFFLKVLSQYPIFSRLRKSRSTNLFDCEISVSQLNRSKKKNSNLAFSQSFAFTIYHPLCFMVLHAC